MRFASHGVLAVFAVLIGLGIGYLMWGLQSADLSRQMEQMRMEYNYKVSIAEYHATAAEERALKEMEARKVFEEELNRMHPQK